MEANQTSEAAPLPFSASRATGASLYLSGMGGMSEGTLVDGGIVPQTEQTLANIAAELERAGWGLDDLVAVTCYLTDIADWPIMNDVWAKFFEGHSAPTRTAIAVADLPMHMLIEMTATASR